MINVPPTNNNESDRINRDIIRNSTSASPTTQHSKLNIQHCRRLQLMVINVQHSTLRFARNSTSASPTIQHSTFNTQHCRRLQFTIG